jgi:peptidylprolyl isomerase
MPSHLVCLLSLIVVAVGCTLKTDEPAPLPPPPDVAAPPADAVRTASGLASKVLRPGRSNVRPTRASTVVVHYTGWTTDGRMFESSVVQGEPVPFGVTDVIPGWTEGVQLMVVGEQRRFWIPGHLAYDNSPNPMHPKGMLVFDVELLEVK